MRSATEADDVPYDRVAARLREGVGSPTVTTLPDGSVDRYYAVAVGSDRQVRSQVALGREIRVGEPKSFRLSETAVDPGGQCVNAAQQAHALGADVTCYGHLDHPVLEDLPFVTVSMGDPANVSVLSFPDGDLLLVDTSADLRNWTLADLRAVADPVDALDAGAVYCANWVSVRGMDVALRGIAEFEAPRIPFVFDPGDVVGSGPNELRSLQAATATLADSVDLVVTANREEVRAMAAVLPDPPERDPRRVAALREATGAAGVVLHGHDRAVAAVDGDLVTVPNLSAEDPARHTGGGDHFGAGLAVALALDWEWAPALALGNTCAVSYVRTGETGRPPDLAATAEEGPEAE